MMHSRPLLLDLFCCAGGAAVGYHRAGFDVVGVDIEPQKHYPFEFHQADAFDYLSDHWHEFDVIHASPPCQVYSVTKSLSNGKHPDLVLPVRGWLDRVGKPYVIENVRSAPLHNPLLLCGTMFGLQVLRHRYFETKPCLIFSPACCSHDGLATGNRSRRQGITTTPGFKDGYSYISVAGNNFLAEDGRIAMAIDWMTKKELAQAIPPAYTEFVGTSLLGMIA